MKQSKYYVDKTELLCLLESKRELDIYWGVSYEEAYEKFASQDAFIEYNLFVKLLFDCETSKMHGLANKGLRHIGDWAKKNKFKLTGIEDFEVICDKEFIK